MTYTPPNRPGAGQVVTSADTDSWYDGLTQLQGANAFLFYQPSVTQTTATSGSKVFINPGTITVPSWATAATVIWSFLNINQANGSAPGTTLQLFVGAAGGIGARLPAKTDTQQFDRGAVSDLITGLSTGPQPVSLMSVLVGGAATAYQAQAGYAVFSANFTFL